MNKPANQKLWNMLVIQAKAKFRTWPSLPASKWVHHQYVEKGGRFLAATDVHERTTAPKTNKTSKKDSK